MVLGPHHPPIPSRSARSGVCEREDRIGALPVCGAATLGFGMNGTGNRGALLVEIIGPAAAGKTSLLRALCSKDEKIRAGSGMRRVRFLGVLIRNVARFLPVWVRYPLRDRWFDWPELRSIAFVDAWDREMEERGSSDLVTIVLDHGPLYRLARLREFGPKITRSRPFERWWHASRDRWMEALDLVVWLDAPDEVLLGRIQERGHQYLDATPSRERKREFLARYRGVFAEILERGTAERPRILRIRSDERSVSEITSEVLDALISESTRAGPTEGRNG